MLFVTVMFIAVINATDIDVGVCLL